MAMEMEVTEVTATAEKEEEGQQLSTFLQKHDTWENALRFVGSAPIGWYDFYPRSVHVKVNSKFNIINVKVNVFITPPSP